MKKPVVLKFIKEEAKAGRYVSLAKTRYLGKGITKVNDGMVIRLGVNYAKIKDSTESTGPLPWGHWLKGYEGYIIEHETKESEERRKKLGITEPQYEYYLRVTTTGNKHHRGKVTYLDENGNELSYDEVVSKVAPSKLKFDDTPIYTIKIDDIISLTSKHGKSKSVRRHK